ncbi:MFS transporter [Candidatus Roizmanbacteria bacterium]|nr:MFS transporter [Candidatus Roizmanbacteria bacterium]
MNSKHWVNRNILYYYLTEFLNNLFFLIPVYISFQNQYLTLTQMGLLASARYILMFLMELPTGVFADLWGRKISCAIGGILDALGLFIIVLYPSSFWIIVGTLIRAIGESAMSGANTALIYDTLKEGGREDEYVKIAAREGIFTQTGLIIATLSGGFLYSVFQTLPFLLTGISIALSSLVYLNMREPHIDTIKYSWSAYINKTKDGLKELFKNTYIKHLSVYFMFVAGISWSWMTYLNLIFINSLGFSESTQGIILSSIRAFNALIIGFVAVKIFSFTKKQGAWIHPIIMGLGALLALIPNPLINILAIVFLMFSSTLRFNLLNKLTNEVFDSRHRATALSALNLLLGVVYSVIVAVSGPLAEVAHPKWIFFWTGIVPLPFIIYLVIKMKNNYYLVKNKL